MWIELVGWREAVITTRDVEQWISFLTELGGWTVRETAPVGEGLKKLWSLPEEATGTETLLGNTGAEKGFIRLIELEGVEHAEFWLRETRRVTARRPNDHEYAAAAAMVLDDEAAMLQRTIFVTMNRQERPLSVV